MVLNDSVSTVDIQDVCYYLHLFTQRVVRCGEVANDVDILRKCRKLKSSIKIINKRVKERVILAVVDVSRGGTQ